MILTDYVTKMLRTNFLKFNLNTPLHLPQPGFYFSFSPVEWVLIQVLIPEINDDTQHFLIQLRV